MPSSQAVPFVGRQPELEALLRLLRAARQGEGGLALVAGEPGIGKTRLLAELAARARGDGWVVLAGRAYQAAGMPPYLPFADALRDYVRSAPPGELRARLGAGAADLGLIVRELHQRLPGLAAPVPLSPELERYRLFESVADFLLAIARGDRGEQVPGLATPVDAAAPGLLLMLDDLHWADLPSLLLLVHLARRCAAAPVLIAGTYRDTEVDAGSPLDGILAALAREQSGERLLLRGLGAAEIANFAEQTAGVDAAIEAHRQAAAALRQPLYLWRTDLLLATQANLQGRFSEAKEIARRAYAIASEAQIVNGFQAYGIQMNVLCLEAGGLEELEPAVRRLIEQYPAVPAFRAAWLLALSRMNRLEEARTELAQLAAAGFATLPRDDNWLSSLARVAEAVATLGATEHAAALYDLLLLHARVGARPWLARTHYDRALMLLRRDRAHDRETASELLGEALNVGRELGMVYLIERIVELQQSAGLGTPAAARRRAQVVTSAAPPAGLAVRQVEVLRRLAGGQTNREIAADLVLSVRTIDHHIGAIYARIGAHGRVDAAAFARRHGLIDNERGTTR